MRTKFQISILIIKNVGPLAPCQGRFPTLGGLVHTYAYHCIPFCMNIMYTKFQTSILINKKSYKIGGGGSGIGYWGPQDGPNLKIEALKILLRV